MNTKKIICTILYVAFVIVTVFTVGNIGQYFDIASFIVVLVIAILYSVAAAGPESFITKFGDGAVKAGWLGSIIGVVAIFGSTGFASANMEVIGASLAVASLTILYGYFFKLGSLILD